MAPAEVFWVSRLSNDTVTLEDRATPGGHGAPACTPVQVSRGSGTLESDGTLTARWARPLTVNTNGTGLVNIVSGVKVNTIAAWAVKKDQQAAPCQMGWGEHATTFTATTVF